MLFNDLIIRKVIPFLNQNCIYEALILLLQGGPEKKLKQFLSGIGILPSDFLGFPGQDRTPDK
jgi:hypothetical protein